MPASQVCDEILWKRARERDAEAFAEVFERHVDRVFRHSLRRAATRTDAEDLTAMVFLAAWEKAGQVRFTDGFILPWLLVVSTNLARHQHRARRRYESKLAMLPAGTPEPDVAEQVVDDLAAAETAKSVAAVIGGLRTTEQAVVSLCDLSGLSYEGTAQALDIPIGTVRSRLSRARSHLRELLRAAPAASASCATVQQAQLGESP